MNNRLHTYFDRTKVGRRDYFRQLIFLTFAPISIILFSLHLFGSYGLNIKPALGVLGILRLGVGSVTHCIYSKRTQKAEVYNERFPLLPYNYTKCATAGISFYGGA